MKFSHTIQFNAVPEWQQHYIAYSSLKKIIYQVEKDLFSRSSPAGEIPEQDEAANLLGATYKANELFLPALTEELKKIVTFYCKKEVDLFTNLEKVLHQAHVFKARSSQVSYHNTGASSVPNFSGANEQSDGPKEDADIIEGSLLEGYDASPNSRAENKNSLFEVINSPVRSANLDPSGSKSHLSQVEGLFGNRGKSQLSSDAIDTFVQLSELKNYVTLNYTGFAKILKKYDKVTGASLLRKYLGQTVQTSYPYLEVTKKKLASQIQKAHELYAELRGINKVAAFEELKAHLREHLVWERNTVWKDMIGLERKVHAVELKSASFDPSAGISDGASVSGSKFAGQILASYYKPFLTFGISFVIFLSLLAYAPFKDPEPNGCLALLVFASLLWATEVIPLFVTALLVPFLVVVLKVLKSEDGTKRLSAPEATHQVFASMFSPVIMLLLGGFSLASALSKHHIAKKLASMVLSYAGNNPSRVLLANMLVATFASMWISNVAAPVLCFSLIQPLLRTLPSKSPYARSLIMGIALASNIGGMASPISSPQNIIALSNMSPPPSWMQWFVVSIPVCMVGIILVWLILLVAYKPSLNNYSTNHIRYTPEELSYTQLFVCGVSILTIVLWCFSRQLEGYFGDMGVLAIVPIFLFFGTGILSKDDFNNFLWTVIILAMGGIALGTGVKSSGLLAIISHGVKDLVGHYTLFQVMFIFCGFTLFVATFISHTVGAVIILPIVAEIGDALPQPHSRLLVMGSALMCSSAMGLPVSGFPNMNAIMMEDETGTRYLSVKDFLKVGVPSSFVLYSVICTMGYAILSILGF